MNRVLHITLALLLPLGLGCIGDSQLTDVNQETSASPTNNNPTSSKNTSGLGSSTSPNNTTGSGGEGSSGTGGGTSNQTGSSGNPTTDEPMRFLPQRIRRLTTEELERAMEHVVLGDVEIAKELPKDTRQLYFKNNDAQIVDPIMASLLAERSAQIAKDATQNRLSQLVSCTTQDRACAEASLTAIAQRAYRRPLTSEEQANVIALYDTALQEPGATFVDGLTLVIEAMLQSPNFLYVTELGEVGAQPSNGIVQMTPWEIAASLALVTTGAPPDEALVQAAKDGSLLQGAVRQAQAERLMATPEGKQHFIHLVMEWLGLDELDEKGKDADAYPNYDVLQAAMEKEAIDFIASILDGGYSLESLLGASYTIMNPDLAPLYGLDAKSGRHDWGEAPRRGILSQSAFLATHSNFSDSGPIHRGVAILERILCIPIPNPGELNIAVTPPEPDPNATTRERFKLHTADDGCSGCHNMIDGVGFAFEQFDAIGQERDMENGKRIDTTGSLLTTSINGDYASSREMVVAISKSSEARQCFARSVFGFASARQDNDVRRSFQALWKKLPDEDKGRMDKALLTFIASDLFIQRRTP